MAVMMSMFHSVNGTESAASDNGEKMQDKIKEELSKIDVDAAIELTEENPVGSKLLESIEG